ncbi:MAG TPA: hypothetical protein VJB14_18195, partial [Planctomycetota bacterium]|nr:hypothetical protein [Planctomycetota bacterium]
MKTILALALILFAQAPPDVDVVRDVEFGKGGGRALKLHLVKPKSPPKEPMAVVVYIYGGGWKAG